MVLTTKAQTIPDLTVDGLQPTPYEIWEKMLRFSGPTPSEIEAMRQTVDVLFQRGYELVVAAYEHLAHFPDTAEVLGWEQGVEEEHLAERRRFFTIWLARTISLDTGSDFAHYLFRAGQIHAAHGPRHIHTPSMWVTGSMALVLDSFARFIREAHHDLSVVAPALTGWNKLLLIQLNQMLVGYESARALDDGEWTLPVKVYGLARHKLGRESFTVRYRSGASVADALRRLVNYAPTLREMLFEQTWRALDDERDLWMRVEPVYVLRGNWRVLINGQDLRYCGGFGRPLQEGDTLSLFPPGR